MKIKTSKGDRTFQVINILIFAIFAIICAYPFYYLIINSISANDLSASGKVNFLPHGFQLENYVKVFQLNGLGTAAMVSLGRTVIGTICTVLASVYLGFMFTQQRMWHRKLWYRFMVITMYFNAGLIPMYMTMKTLHLTNSFWVYIIPAIVQPFNIIMAKTYVESIPPALQEAAEIDGAGTMTVFAKVILPTCKPIMATIAIWSAVGQWNSFQDTLIYITDQKLYSLQYLLYTYLNQASSLATMVQQSGGNVSAVANLATQQTPTSIRMTISVIVVLPILFVYPIFQKSFVKVGIGAEKKSRIISDKEKKITAYHEAGHAILFHVLPDVGPVYSVSIIPTGMGAAGYTMPLPEKDEMFMTKGKMIQDIVVSLGGRVAEELIFDDITTGASQDIKQATKTARAMVTKYGMSEKIGLLSYGGDDDEVFIGRDLAHTRSYSETVAAQIDEEVHAIVTKCHEDARRIIGEHMDVLHRCADLLIEKEKITKEEFERLFD